MGGNAPPGSLNTLSGVIVPTCENMWGVLIFLRFFYVVGHAGVWQALVIVFVSFLSSLCTTMSLSAMATNGPVEAGGAYYIISRALGHKLGGAVGTTYWPAYPCSRSWKSSAPWRSCSRWSPRWTWACPRRAPCASGPSCSPPRWEAWSGAACSS